MLTVAKARGPSPPPSTCTARHAQHPASARPANPYFFTARWQRRQLRRRAGALRGLRALEAVLFRTRRAPPALPTLPPCCLTRTRLTEQAVASTLQLNFSIQGGSGSGSGSPQINSKIIYAFLPPPRRRPPPPALPSVGGHLNNNSFHLNQPPPRPLARARFSTWSRWACLWAYCVVC